MSSEKVSQAQFKSKEELYFHWYLLELENMGFIADIQYEPHSFPLFAPVINPWIKKLKTKDKQESYELLKGMRYTPDFKFKWLEKAKGVFIAVKYQNPKQKPFSGLAPICWVDVKGSFTSRESFRIFPLYQKMMWHIFDIMVDKVMIPQIFAKTFTPERYLLTDKTMKKRSINFKLKTLNGYFTDQREELLSINPGPDRPANHQQQPVEPI